jgi:hypothetical protein
MLELNTNRHTKALYCFEEGKFASISALNLLVQTLLQNREKIKIPKESQKRQH